MIKWSVWFSTEAKKDFIKLDKSLRRRIVEKLEWLVANFDSVKPISLTADWRDFFKLRIGSWRAVYKIDYNNNLIRVYTIDRRDKIYKRKV